MKPLRLKDNLIPKEHGMTISATLDTKVGVSLIIHYCWQKMLHNQKMVVSNVKSRMANASIQRIEGMTTNHKLEVYGVEF